VENLTGVKVVTLKDFIETPRRAKLARREGEWVVINGPSDYEILFSRCNTPEKVLSWVRHLAEKSWVTCEHLTDFIDACEIKRLWI